MSKHNPDYAKFVKKRGLTVTVRPVFQGAENAKEQATKNFEFALRSFKDRILKEGLHRELKAKEFYESKAQKARRKKKESEKRVRKLQKMNDY